MKKILIMCFIIGFCITLLKASDTINIGGMLTMTGPTSEEGIPFANGAIDAFEYINSKGGVNDRKINFIYQDYGYNLDNAFKWYDELRGKNISAIVGWGTADTEELRPKIADDKIPYVSAAYAEGLADLSVAPYNFLVGTTYSDQMRVAIKWIKDNITDRTPKIALIYNDTAFGLSPIQDARDYAKSIGVEIVDEQIVALNANSARTELTEIMKHSPDYIFIQQTGHATSVIVRDAHAMQIDTKFIALNWGLSETTARLIGDAGRLLLGISSFTFPTENPKGMEDINSFLSSSGKTRFVNLRYVQGWVSAMLIVEALNNIDDGNYSGEAVRRELRNIKNFTCGDLTLPISFSDTSHKGCSSIKLYKIEDGAIEPFTDILTL